MKKIILFCLIALTFVSCSTSKPALLPNEKFKTTSDVNKDLDVDECLKLADHYASNSDKWKEIAGKTAKSSVIGTAAGAVGGAIVHSAGHGAAIGAASGAVVALLEGLWSAGDADPTYRHFVEYCLQQKGYEIAGW